MKTLIVLSLFILLNCISKGKNKKLKDIEFLENRFGFYVLDDEIEKTLKDLPRLQAKGITDIFLHVEFYLLKPKVENFVNIAKKYNIRVHVWIDIFFDGIMHINPLKNATEIDYFFFFEVR